MTLVRICTAAPPTRPFAHAAECFPKSIANLERYLNRSEHNITGNFPKNNKEIRNNYVVVDALVFFRAHRVNTRAKKVENLRTPENTYIPRRFPTRSPSCTNGNTITVAAFSFNFENSTSIRRYTTRACVTALPSIYYFALCSVSFFRLIFYTTITNYRRQTTVHTLINCSRDLHTKVDGGNEILQIKINNSTRNIENVYV